MAVANSRYFMQRANSASAYAYDNNGSEIGKITNNDTLTLNAKTNDTHTLYSLIGESFVVVGGLTTAVLLIYKKCKRQA